VVTVALRPRTAFYTLPTAPFSVCDVPRVATIDIYTLYYSFYTVTRVAVLRPFVRVAVNSGLGLDTVLNTDLNMDIQIHSGMVVPYCNGLHVVFALVTRRLDAAPRIILHTFTTSTRSTAFYADAFWWLVRLGCRDGYYRVGLIQTSVTNTC